jgi:hypothetical protein
MRKPTAIEKLARQCLRVNERSTGTDRELDDRTLTDALSAYQQSYRCTQSPRSWFMTRLAVAAVVLVGVSLGIVLFRGSNGSAYAIEQTMGALKAITTVHAIGTDWYGNRFEAWNKVDPATGEVVWCCLDQTPYRYKIASRPDGSCVWDKDGKVVRYSNQRIATNDFRFTHVFEQIAEKMGQLNENERITIEAGKDPARGAPLIVIHVVTQMQDYRIYVDAETKLPVRLVFDRADNMQQITRTLDEIHYDVPLPEGMFDFQVPPEWYRDWSLLDDPAKGLAIGELTHEQGAVLIAKEYWQAVIDGNWAHADRLRPIADWKTDYRKDRPTELIDVGTPRPQRGCTGLVTPCIVRFEDGRLMKVELVVNYRRIDSQASCIIVATWGWSQVLSEPRDGE